MFDPSAQSLTAQQARAARSYLGMSQAKVAELSGLPAHILKRFEAPGQPGSVYVPDEDFLQKLRAFYEGRGYVFGDAPTPGAKAKDEGRVFPAGVVGVGNDTSTGAAPARPARPVQAQFHHMRIAITDPDEMGRVLDLIESNELQADKILQQKIETGLFGNLAEKSQVNHAEALKLLAENGKLFARLFGRDVGGAPKEEIVFGTAKPETLADLLHQRQADALRVVAGDREAMARRQQHKPAGSLFGALFG